MSKSKCDCATTDPNGHLSAWMRDQCDMSNEGDRMAWEQYQTLIKTFKAICKLSDGSQPIDVPGIYMAARAALKAAEGE